MPPSAGTGPRTGTPTEHVKSELGAKSKDTKPRLELVIPTVGTVRRAEATRALLPPAVLVDALGHIVSDSSSDTECLWSCSDGSIR